MKRVMSLLALLIVRWMRPRTMIRRILLQTCTAIVISPGIDVPCNVLHLSLYLLVLCAVQLQVQLCIKPYFRHGCTYRNDNLLFIRGVWHSYDTYLSSAAVNNLSSGSGPLLWFRAEFCNMSWLAAVVTDPRFGRHAGRRQRPLGARGVPSTLR